MVLLIWRNSSSCGNTLTNGRACLIVTTETGLGTLMLKSYTQVGEVGVVLEVGVVSLSWHDQKDMDLLANLLVKYG